MLSISGFEKLSPSLLSSRQNRYGKSKANEKKKAQRLTKKNFSFKLIINIVKNFIMEKGAKSNNPIMYFDHQHHNYKADKDKD